MSWNVKLSHKASKQCIKLPRKVQSTLRLLVKDLQTIGPAVPDWPNYGKLKGQRVIKDIVISLKASPLMFAVGK